MSSIKEVITKGTVRGILALLFGVTTCAGFALGLLGEQTFEKALLIIFVFFFATKPNNGTV